MAVKGREALPVGTVICTSKDTFTVTGYNLSGGMSILYFVHRQGSDLPYAIKEFFPAEGWQRRNGAAVPILPDMADSDSVLTQSLKDAQTSAENELAISQAIAVQSHAVQPYSERLEVQQILLPDGAGAWTGDPLPCSMLLTEALKTQKDGLWLTEILHEITYQKEEPGHPLGCRQPDEDASCVAVPLPLALGLMSCLLASLNKLHAAGYVHTDLNRGNLYFIFDTSDPKNWVPTTCRIIDFGCAKKLNADGRTAPIPYQSLTETPGFCPPEVEEAADQKCPLCLTTAADVFAAGRLLLMMLDPYYAHPQSTSCMEDLQYAWLDEYSKTLGVPVETALRLQKLINDTAEEDPAKRITLADLITQLRDLKKELEPPVWKVSLSLPALADHEVIGREADITAIEKRLNEQGNPLFLYGFSGMGKTKLALSFGHRWQREYPDARVYFCRFPPAGGLAGLIADVLGEALVPPICRLDEHGASRSQKDICDEVLNQLRSYLRPHDILIIDNVDSEVMDFTDLLYGTEEELAQDPWKETLFDRLNGIRAHVILTTRFDLTNENLNIYKVDTLRPETLLALMRQFYKGICTDDELRALIDLVGAHTMTVSMIARTMEQSNITPAEMLHRLQQQDGLDDPEFEKVMEKAGGIALRKYRIGTQLRRLFRMQNLGQKEQSVLRDALLIGESGMLGDVFVRCCSVLQSLEDDALKQLCALGYIQQDRVDEQAYFTIHTLVYLIGQKELSPHLGQCCKFLRELENQSEEDRQLRLSFADSLIRAADMELPGSHELTEDELHRFFRQIGMLKKTDEPYRWRASAAQIYKNLDMPKKGLATLDKALSLRLNDAGGIELCTLYREKAEIYGTIGRWQQEYDCALQAVQVMEEHIQNPEMKDMPEHVRHMLQIFGSSDQLRIPGGHSTLAGALLQYGTACLNLGYYVKALHAARKGYLLCVVFYPQENDWWPAEYYGLLGDIFAATAQTEKRDFCRRKEKEYTSKLSIDEMEVADNCSRYAADEQDPEKKLEWYLKARAILKKNHISETDTRMILSDNSCGTAYLEIGKTLSGEEAEAALKKALPLLLHAYKNWPDPQHPFYGRICNNIGSCYYYLKQPEESLKYLEQALQLRITAGAPDFDLAVGHYNLASTCIELKQYDIGLQHGEEMRRLMEKVYSSVPDHPQLAACYESLSVYYREAQNAVTGDRITEYRNKRFRYLQQAMKIYNARSDSTEPLKRCLEDYIEILYQPDAAQVECKKLVQQGKNIKELQKDACQKMLECISTLLSENGPSPELMEDVSYYVRKRMEFGPPDKQSNLP